MLKVYELQCRNELIVRLMAFDAHLLCFAKASTKARPRHLFSQVSFESSFFWGNQKCPG